MSVDIEQMLREHLSGIEDIGKVGGDLVPLPSATGNMQNHLFVNLSFTNSSIRYLNTKELLGRLRGIALFVFITISRFLEIGNFASVVVSIFAPITDSEGLRIYRTRLKTDSLTILNESNYMELVTGEESGDADIRELLISVE